MRRIVGLLLLGLFSLCLARAASAHLIDGFLGECTAVTATTCTENTTATGYARQPIYFNGQAKGLVTSGYPFRYAGTVAGSLAGRAIYDAPTGGNLLVIMPYATPYVIPSNGDTGDVAAITLTLTALLPYQFPETYSGTVASGATLGTMPDGSTVTSGRTLSFLHGMLIPGTLAPT